jgi:hypothetical protein
MTPERFRQVRDVFERAMQLPSEARSSYIHRECVADTELGHEVEEMLEAAEQSNCPIDHLAMEAISETQAATTASAGPLPAIETSARSRPARAK